MLRFYSIGVFIATIVSVYCLNFDNELLNYPPTPP